VLRSMRIPSGYLQGRAIPNPQGVNDMQTLLAPATATKPRRSLWRVVALGAASTVALAACGASAAGTASPSTSTRSPTTAAASSASPATTAAAAAPDPAATAAVGIINFKFTPSAVTVKVGTTVVWTNNDTVAHTVNFDTGGINSNVLNQNDQFSYTFSTPGTYAYICAIHPFMHGSVTVTT
jgi:amicyanin